MDVEKTIEFILEQMAHVVAMQAKMGDDLARRERMGERTDRRLDRAIRLAVREARNERKRRQELDARLTASHARVDSKFEELAEAQRATAAALKAFLTGRGGNGSQGNGND